MRAVSIDGKDAVIVVLGVGTGAAAAKGGGALGAVGAGAATGGATGGATVDGTTVSTAGDTVMRIECVSSLIASEAGAIDLELAVVCERFGAVTAAVLGATAR